MWKNHRKLLIVDTEYFTFIIFVTFPLHIINILSELRHCVCAHVCADALVYIFTCGGQRLTLGCLSSSFLFS